MTRSLPGARRRAAAESIGKRIKKRGRAAGRPQAGRGGREHRPALARERPGLASAPRA